MRFAQRIAIACLTALFHAVPALADDGEATPKRDPGFAGPSSVPSQIAEDAAPTGPVFRANSLQRAFKPYYDAKARLAKRYGLQLAGDYTLLVQHLTESLGEETAVGAIARAYGTWDLVNRGCPNGGSLVFKGENRYAMTDVAPLGLGFETGYVGVTGPPFTDIRWALTNLYWRQRFARDRVSVIAGIVDATDYLDIYGLINPWTSFQNLAFLTSPTIAVPNQGLGLAASGMLSDHLYLMAGIADANGDPTRNPFDAFDDSEWFKHVELGWVSAKDRFFLDNVHVTAWHADERERAGAEESWGVTASGAFFLCDRWMPFLRAGWAEGTAPVWDRSVSAGVGYYVRQGGDLAALGVSWGRPSGTTVEDQWTLEAYYRLQLLQSMALTPSVQLLVNPAANPDADLVTLFGLRWRVTF